MVLRRIVILIIILSAGSAQAVSEDQYQSIIHLGQLNGIALHCHYLDETRRMKGALIKALPKRRQLGDAFDLETNKAFLKFIEDGATCPKETVFIGQVDQAIDVMYQQFKP